MLRIVKREDAVEVKNLVVTIYGQPGIGKSTLGFAIPSSLTLDFDGGGYRAANRKDMVQIESWDEVARISEEDLAGYSTVVIDTAGRALDFLTSDIIKKNAKMGRGGALTLQGYGALKAEFVGWLRNLRTMGKDVVLIAHSSEEKSGDDMLERLDVQGGSKGEIYKSADAMGRISIQNGRRYLNFSPTDTSFGKNPAGFKPIPIPEITTEPDFFGKLIQSIKDALNSMSQEQMEKMKLVSTWKEDIDQVTISEPEVIDHMNGLLEQLANSPDSIKAQVKHLVWAKAKELGLEYDKSNFCFVLGGDHAEN